MGKEKKKSRLLYHPSCSTIGFVSGGTESSLVNNQTRSGVFHYETISYVMCRENHAVSWYHTCFTASKMEYCAEKCSESIITEPKCITLYDWTPIFIHWAILGMLAETYHGCTHSFTPWESCLSSNGMIFGGERIPEKLRDRWDGAVGECPQKKWC